MKRYFIVMILVLATLAGAASLPDFTADNLDGNQVDADDLLGQKLTIMSFWGTTCTPCKAELALLDSLYEIYADSGLSIIAVNTDPKRGLSRVKPMVTSLGWDFPVLIDPDGKLMQLFKVSVIPHSVYVSRDKQILKVSTGYTKKDDAEIVETILEALHADIPAFSMGSCEPVRRSSSVEITVKKDVDMKVVLSDSSGEIVKTIHEGALEAGVHTIEIKVAELEQGTYSVTADDGETTQTSELLIEE